MDYKAIAARTKYIFMCVGLISFWTCGGQPSIVKKTCTKILRLFRIKSIIKKSMHQNIETLPIVEKMQSSIAKKIMHQNLEAFPYQDEDWSTDRYCEFLEHVIKAQLDLQEFLLRRTAFLMLDRYVTKHHIVPSTVLADPLTWKDLNFFCGQKDLTSFLADKIDRSNTIFGTVTLYNWLAQPQVETQVINDRQEVIRELVNNPHLLETLVHELQEFKKIQSILLSFWTNDPFKQAAQRKYFNYSPKAFMDVLNNNATILNIRLVLDHIGRCVLQTGATVAAAGILPAYGISMLADCKLPEAAQVVPDRFKGSGGPFFRFIPPLLAFNNKLLGLFFIGEGLVCGLNIKESAEWTMDNFTIEQFMHTKIKYVAEAVRRLKNIRTIIASNECLSRRFTKEFGLRLLFSGKQSKELSAFLKSIVRIDFHEKTSLFTNRGAMLVAFKQFCSLKEEFEDALIDVGELDAFVGLARLYKEHENGTARYCFARFAEKEQPYFSLKGFWNPFIHPSKVVCNSVELGGDDLRRNMIITGPNAGGKSTILKALTTTVVMAQTVGIAPGEDVVLTPFDKIITYLNVVDDIGAGNSLFKAQVLRTQYIADQIAALPATQKSLAIFDEMYNGTSPKEAQACAYSVAKNMGSYSNNMSLIATHHDLLTALEQETDCYINYCVSVIKQISGLLTYPFLLQPGIADQHIALDILRNEGFGSSIIDEAQRILDRVG
jgi:DNA mismatch repair ATPase MutS